jgi:hypothetical protein
MNINIYKIDIHNIIIINKERTCLKGHDYWLRAPLRGYINERSFSIVSHLIYSYFIHLYIIPTWIIMLYSKYFG